MFSKTSITHTFSFQPCYLITPILLGYWLTAANLDSGEMRDYKQSFVCLNGVEMLPPAVYAAGAPFKSPMTVHFYRGTADQICFSVMVFNKGLPMYTGFPSICPFPLHQCSFSDCLCIQGHTYGVALLLMSTSGQTWKKTIFFYTSNVSAKTILPKKVRKLQQK